MPAARRCSSSLPLFDRSRTHGSVLEARRHELRRACPLLPPDVPTTARPAPGADRLPLRRADAELGSGEPPTAPAAAGLLPLPLLPPLPCCASPCPFSPFFICCPAPSPASSPRAPSLVGLPSPEPEWLDADRLPSSEALASSSPRTLPASLPPPRLLVSSPPPCLQRHPFSWTDLRPGRFPKFIPEKGRGGSKWLLMLSLPPPAPLGSPTSCPLLPPPPPPLQPGAYARPRVGPPHSRKPTVPPTLPLARQDTPSLELQGSGRRTG